MNKIRNERGDVTADNTKILRIIRNYDDNYMPMN